MKKLDQEQLLGADSTQFSSFKVKKCEDEEVSTEIRRQDEISVVVRYFPSLFPIISLTNPFFLYSYVKLVSKCKYDNSHWSQSSSSDPSEQSLTEPSHRLSIDRISSPLLHKKRSSYNEVMFPMSMKEGKKKNKRR